MAAEDLWVALTLCPEKNNETISSLMMWANSHINFQHHWDPRPELKTKNIFGYKGHLQFVSKVILESLGCVYEYYEWKIVCLAVSNLPVQWLWPGLWTSAGMHWGCVAQRLLRHLRIVAPENQLVTWRWWQVDYSGEAVLTWYSSNVVM